MLCGLTDHVYPVGVQSVATHLVSQYRVQAQNSVHRRTKFVPYRRNEFVFMALGTNQFLVKIPQFMTAHLQILQLFLLTVV